MSSCSSAWFVDFVTFDPPIGGGSGGGAGTAAGAEILSFLVSGLLLTVVIGCGGAGGESVALLGIIVGGPDVLLGPRSIVLAFSSSCFPFILICWWCSD